MIKLNPPMKKQPAKEIQGGNSKTTLGKQNNPFIGSIMSLSIIPLNNFLGLQKA